MATAYELLDQQPDLRVTAVGTARGLETTVIPAAGLPLSTIPPVPMPRRPGVDLALVGPRLVQAVRESVAVLRRVGAQAVLGFGGYVSTPAYLAARRLGLPIVLHEQNLLPGLANRLAARLTHHVFTSFPTTPWRTRPASGCRCGASVTDEPGCAPRTGAGYVRSAGQGDALLVSGGSQGASSINRAVREASPALLAAGISVLHVLGARNITSDDVRVVGPGHRRRTYPGRLR